MEFKSNILPDLESPESFFQLGWQLLYEEGRFEDSERAFRVALEKAPGNTEAQLEMAVACLLQGKNKEGIAVLNDVISRATDNDSLAEAHLRLGVAYDNLRNDTMANMELEILRKLDPDRAEVLERLMEM
jgi:tetratricopeptide (TPR) repeat protein